METSQEQMSSDRNLSPAGGNSDGLVVVGIGASAGGLESLRIIFSHVKNAEKTAYIVVQHMSPTSKSLLAELISRETTLQVEEAKNGSILQEGVVYVTPPNYDILIDGNAIKLTDLMNRTGPKPSIDRFFISLAEQFGDHAIGCVLSGTGSDGAQGIKAIKAAGGITIAQEPKSSKYDGMPKAAIATNAIDLTLQPTEIPPDLESIAARLIANKAGLKEKWPDEPYKGILDLLNRRLNINFQLYKQKTIHRRLSRRMNAVKVNSISEYYDYLKETPSEIHKLFYDILISVTSFFRDEKQYDELFKLFKKYIQSAKPSKSIRIWSAGCATGEEPYSLAILAKEALRDYDVSYADQIQIQVFATDISDEAMATARKGFFPESTLMEMDQDRLNKYFTRDEGGFRINKEIRDSVLFARHDLTNDPPFLKMDLISCRNVFIYFEPEVQEKIIKIFHYALNLDGLLFLGKSESTGSQKSYFENQSSHSKIYRRVDRQPDPTITFGSLLNSQASESFKSRGLAVRKTKNSENGINEVVKSFCPNSIILDDYFNITTVLGNAGRYLRFPDGNLSNSLEGLSHPDLKNHFITLAHRCKRSGKIAHSGSMPFKTLGKPISVEVEAIPLAVFNEPLYVLSVEEIKRHSRTGEPDTQQKTSKEFEELERDLIATREQLQTVIEEQETSNEELQALNEELQSANEELQSTNEELETSNEELQSTNEELTTVNEELNVKTAELAELTNHLTVIQDAVKSPILVVDSKFCLSSFNNIAKKVLALDQSQLGKNVRLVIQDSSYAPVFEIAEKALKEVSSQTCNISTSEFEFESHCVPISSEDKAVNGVVITLIDNTKVTNALRQAELSKSTMFEILTNIPAKVSLKDTQGKYTFVNASFCKLLGKHSKDIIGKTDQDFFEEQELQVRQARDQKLVHTKKVIYTEDTYKSSDGSKKIYHTARLPIVDENGHVSAICSVGVDISGRISEENRLKNLHHALASTNDCFAMFEKQKGIYQLSFASDSLATQFDLVQETSAPSSLRQVLNKITADFTDKQIKEMEEKIISNKRFLFEFAKNAGAKNNYYELKSYKIPTNSSHPNEPEYKLFVGIFDITDKKVIEIQSKKMEEEFMKTGRLASLGEMAAGIAHELKTPLNTIQGYIDLIHEYQDQNSPIPNPIQESLDNIESTVSNISDIIVGLKSISKATGQEKFVLSKIDEIMDNVTRVSSFHIKNKGIQCEFEVNCPGEKIEVNPTLINQVLINLINNSIDAVGNTRNAWIKVSVDKIDEKILFSVTDSGDGIPESVANQLMTPFFTTKKSGTGLGLSLSQNIAKLHNGSLTIDTNNKNTSFVLAIPSKRIAPEID